MARGGRGRGTGRGGKAGGRGAGRGNAYQRGTTGGHSTKGQLSPHTKKIVARTKAKEASKLNDKERWKQMKTVARMDVLVQAGADAKKAADKQVKAGRLRKKDVAKYVQQQTQKLAKAGLKEREALLRGSLKAEKKESKKKGKKRKRSTKKGKKKKKDDGWSSDSSDNSSTTSSSSDSSSDSSSSSSSSSDDSSPSEKEVHLRPKKLKAKQSSSADNAGGPAPTAGIDPNKLDIAAIADIVHQVREDSRKALLIQAERQQSADRRMRMGMERGIQNAIEQITNGAAGGDQATPRGAGFVRKNLSAAALNNEGGARLSSAKKKKKKGAQRQQQDRSAIDTDNVFMNKKDYERYLKFRASEHKLNTAGADFKQYKAYLAEQINSCDSDSDADADEVWGGRVGDNDDPPIYDPVNDSEVEEGDDLDPGFDDQFKADNNGLTRAEFNAEFKKAEFKKAHHGLTSWPVYPTRHGGASHGLAEPTRYVTISDSNTESNSSGSSSGDESASDSTSMSSWSSDNFEDIGTASGQKAFRFASSGADKEKHRVTARKAAQVEQISKRRGGEAGARAAKAQNDAEAKRLKANAASRRSKAKGKTSSSSKSPVASSKTNKTAKKRRQSAPAGLSKQMSPLPGGGRQPEPAAQKRKAALVSILSPAQRPGKRATTQPVRFVACSKDVPPCPPTLAGK